VLVTFAPGGQAVRALEPEGVIDHFDALGGEVGRLLA
jgi:phosphoglycolate phosphatase